MFYGVKFRCKTYEFTHVNEEALKNTLERIGSKLTDLRKKKGYSSHEDFAYDFDLPRVQYWRIEKGKANLTIKSLYRLLAIHKLSVEEFFCILYKESKK
jgi:transcriptional regulator with XRE-family HTH domain